LINKKTRIHHAGFLFATLLLEHQPVLTIWLIANYLRVRRAAGFLAARAVVARVAGLAAAVLACLAKP
jgi:hypothetical protein